jgi:hypothetical protein
VIATINIRNNPLFNADAVKRQTKSLLGHQRINNREKGLILIFIGACGLESPISSPADKTNKLCKIREELSVLQLH